MVQPPSGPTLGALVSPLRVPPPLADWRPAAINNDSRHIGPEALFVAYRGLAADGRDYLQDAFRRGAQAALVEPDTADKYKAPPKQMSLVEYPGLKEDLGKLAGRFYDWPDKQLEIAAVTGTAGKTTVAWLTASLLHRAGRPCGMIGTVGAGMAADERLQPLQNTTPDLLYSRNLLRSMLHQSATAVVLEASSEGLRQSRLSGMRVRVAAFTNLGSDHLQVHGGVAGLKRAKRMLFELPSVHKAVLNLDDPFGARLADDLRRERPDIDILSYGQSPEARVHLRFANEQPASIEILGRQIQAASLAGRHNGYNLACALATAHALGLDSAQLCEAARQPMTLPPGRLQKVFSAPDCYVDYAHSPEALEAVLLALRPLCGGRLRCVFGCGGERDQQKRPLMGAIAARLADRIYITSDNPRGEDAEAIMEQILAGADAAKNAAKEVSVQSDRKLAIRQALDEAAPADTVLIAGKGHEQVQQIGEQRLPFSDVRVARQWHRQGHQQGHQQGHRQAT